MSTQLVVDIRTTKDSPCFCYAYTHAGTRRQSMCSRRARYVVLERFERLGWSPIYGYCAHHAPEYVNLKRVLRMDHD